MQTFLSETTFSGSAEVLDKIRLNKQFLEARQIMDMLLAENPSKSPWSKHPAVLQWKNHEYYLWLYIKRIREECINRGISVEKNTTALVKYIPIIAELGKTQVEPIWWSDETLKDKVVITHRARLYEKDPVHYAQYAQWVEPAKDLICCSHCNYFWPSHWEKNGNKFLVTNKKRNNIGKSQGK